MLKYRFIGLLLIVLLSAGCSNDENNEASNNDVQPQTINYETKNEQNARLGIQDQTIGERGGYPQTDQDDINRGDSALRDNADIFTNEQSKKIANRLMKRQDIKAAQVAITDDKIVIGLMLNDHGDHNITKGIKEDVRKFDQEKTIIVYTDDIHWDRMSNLKARHEQSNLTENIKKFFNPDHNE